MVIYALWFILGKGEEMTIRNCIGSIHSAEWSGESSKLSRLESVVSSLSHWAKAYDRHGVLGSVPGNIDSFLDWSVGRQFLNDEAEVLHNPLPQLVLQARN